MARHWPEVEVGKTYRFINEGIPTSKYGQVMSMQEHGEYKRSYLVVSPCGKVGGYMWFSRVRPEPSKPYYFDRVEVAYGEEDTQRTGA